MQQKMFWFKIASVAIGAAFGAGLIFLLLFGYVEWKVGRGEEVDLRLRKLDVVRERHHAPAYTELMGVIAEERGGTFQTHWDFDHGIALSRGLYAPTRMYGQMKYRYHPNIPVVNARVWSGLHFQSIAAVRSERVESLLEDLESSLVVQFETDEHGFKPTEFSQEGRGPAIFLLGDSFTEGLWTSPKETFASVFGGLLQADGIDATPYNLGVNGYSALEMSWLLEFHAPLLDPKVVIVNLFPNDVHNRYLQVIQGRGATDDDYRTMFRFLERMKKFCTKTGCSVVISLIPAKEQFNSPRRHAAFQDRVMAWCYVGGLGFVVICLGLVLMGAGVSMAVIRGA